MINKAAVFKTQGERSRNNLPPTGSSNKKPHRPVDSAGLLQSPDAPPQRARAREEGGAPSPSLTELVLLPQIL